MNKGIMLFCALALARAAYPITATKAYVDGATNATLAAAKAYTDSVAGVTPAVVTNIAGRVTSNVVTKAYVESLGISGGGADTNAVNDLIVSYDTTNLTARIASKRDITNRVWSAAGYTPWTCTSTDSTLNAILNDRTTYPNGAFVWDEMGWWSPPTVPGYQFGTYEQPGGRDTFILRGFFTRTTDSAIINFTATRTQTPADNLALTSELAAATNGLADAAAVTGIVASAAVTNAGAVAYTEAKFLPLTGGASHRMTGNIQFEDNGVFLGEIGYNTISGNPAISTETDEFEFYGHTFVSILKSDDSPVATSNMVESVIASKPSPSPLTGKTYDFANGVNFTKTLYTALTNVIQTLGGTVTNAPNFN